MLVGQIIIFKRNLRMNVTDLRTRGQIHLRRLYTSESDVSKRLILTYKDGPRAEGIKTFLMVVDP